MRSTILASVEIPQALVRISRFCRPVRAGSNKWACFAIIWVTRQIGVATEGKCCFQGVPFRALGLNKRLGDWRQFCVSAEATIVSHARADTECGMLPRGRSGAFGCSAETTGIHGTSFRRSGRSCEVGLSARFASSSIFPTLTPPLNNSGA